MCGFMVYHGQSLSVEAFQKAFASIKHRGPDDTRVIKFENAIMGFHRLAIMDTSSKGMQPFINADGDKVVCNGEIYNFEHLKSLADYDFESHSDCELLLPLYKRYGLETLLDLLDGEFAFVLWDQKKKRFVAGRDPLGIRPMFYGYAADAGILFASEVKALQNLCEDISPFPPGHYFDGERFVRYWDPAPTLCVDGLDDVLVNIREKLTTAVVKRLHADVPVGFLLSGGLDSSLVCAIAQRFSSRPIRTFAIGMKSDAIDLKYARETADFLGTEHQEVIISESDVLANLSRVVEALETWDITTIRASMGMYLLCKAIRETTDVKVLFTGEVSDELFGYKYTDFAPSPQAFQEEAVKRVSELYMYDVLRADRCISAHGLEARVPFSDKDFVSYVMSIHPELKINRWGIGKYLLRQAFAKGKYLPVSILMREKAAFSDAVGHSLVDSLKSHAANLYKTMEGKTLACRFPHATPFSSESLMYRECFESYYPKKSKLIKDFWMPNQAWQHCKVNDPSARVLPNYGQSGI
ncbi:MAG: asparagine synthase B [Deltaproteobacteria bacterium]|nr:asparagine synthase B [Deltaproteobacteria bacterium]